MAQCYVYDTDVLGLHETLIEKHSQPLTAAVSVCLSFFGGGGGGVRVGGICAIYKRRPRHLPDNYRPISLLSSVTKVLESLVNKYLSNFLSANNLISPFQSGFRRGDSAPLQLFRLTTELLAALDSRAVAAAVFYDFKKAFDSVWHRASSESSSLLECPVQPLSGYQTLLLTVHSTSKWATLFLTLALQRLVFPKVPLSAQCFHSFH